MKRRDGMVVLAMAGMFVQCAAADIFKIAEYGDIKIQGYVGKRLDDCLANHVNVTDGMYLTDVFKNKDETGFWQTEFWGKWMHSAVPFLAYAESPLLKADIDASLHNLLSTQLPDGYIGNYRLDQRCNQGWDIWGQKYTLLGLLHSYDGTHEKTSLDAACRLADYLMANVGPGKRDLYKTGNYRGMPSCSVLEPIVWLYNRTKQQKYLDFAKYIVSQLEDPEDSAKLISRALAGVDVADRTPHPKSWWAWENGMKAYEMMSCYQGLLEYYEVTGDRRCLDAAVATAKNIIATEINVVGGGASCECWYHGKNRQTFPFAKTMETCVLTTWIRFCEKLLLVTGDPSYADELEKTFYNAYLGALYKDGSVFSQYSPLSGTRSRGENHCRMQTNCCNSNGPRGLLSFIRAFLMARGNEAIMNLYETSRVSIELPAKKEKVTFETFTQYPKNGNVIIWNRTAKSLEFTLKLRIPAWAETTWVKVNGTPVTGIKSGSYLAISRVWNPGDMIDLSFDMICRAQVLNDCVAFTRGPIVLTRDARFHDGNVDEVIRPSNFSNPIALTPVNGDREGIWMSFVAFLNVGTHSENLEKKYPAAVHFCDFASAGGTWTSDSTYRVWLPLEMDAATHPYKK